MKKRSRLRRVVGLASACLLLLVTATAQEKSGTRSAGEKEPGKASKPMRKIMKMRPAPRRSVDELKARYAKKVASPFIAKGKWILDYDEARERAKREGKLIFVYYTRSYAP